MHKFNHTMATAHGCVGKWHNNATPLLDYASIKSFGTQNFQKVWISARTLDTFGAMGLDNMPQYYPLGSSLETIIEN
jgi:hypothetical protein